MEDSPLVRGRGRSRNAASQTTIWNWMVYL